MVYARWYRLVVMMGLFGGGLVYVRGAWGQGVGVLTLPRLEGAIHLDGVSEEPAWQDVEPLSMTMYLPTYAGTPSEKTEVRLGYDDTYLYASGRFFDSDASGIRVNSLYRDLWSGDDSFTLYIDSFNDNENALWFTTNPAGIRMDQALSEDGDVVNANWNAFWDVATTVNEEGWFAEIRIPLSSLGFQVQEDGSVVMGVVATRYIARKNERVTFPAIPPRWSYRKPSVAQDVRLEGVRSRKPLYVTPYTLGGLDRATQLDPAETAFRAHNEMINEVGLDLKYNLTSNLTLGATLNTDFAQVEADDQQVNLTRFSLFFPEKRQFFQERSGTFDFDMGRGGRLFHSRRIGLTETGEAVRLLGGARIVGRVGPWDLGLLDLQTARAHGFSSENFGVFRLRRQVFNAYSYVGTLLTNRVDEEGHYNTAYGVDGTLRLAGDEYLTIKWAQTFDREGGEAPASHRAFLETGQVFVRWDRDVSSGLQYSASFGWSGPGYDPGVGFTNREDFKQFNGFVSYVRLTDRRRRLRALQPGLFWNTIFRNRDGRLESAHAGLWVSLFAKSGTAGWIEPQLYYEDVEVPFQLSEEVLIPAGRYTFGNLWLNYQLGDGNLLRTDADLKVGSFYDGRHLQFVLTPTWNLSRHLEVSGAYELNLIRFTGRAQRLDTHLARLRVRSALDAHLSGHAFVQYNAASDVFSVNARLRYNFREGKDLWLVYNEGLNLDRHRHIPSLPHSDTRTLAIKYTHTFTL